MNPMTRTATTWAECHAYDEPPHADDIELAPYENRVRAVREAYRDQAGLESIRQRTGESQYSRIS